MRVLSAVLVLLALAACGEEKEPSPDPVPSSASGPAAVVEQLITGLEKGDCDAVKASVLAPDAVDCTAVAESAGDFAQVDLDVDAIEYVVSDETGTTAKVTLDWGEEGDVFDVSLVDGAWKVDFESGAGGA